MPEALEIFLIRHGQSTANARGIWQGQLDFPLSDEGREQARRAGKALASGSPPIAVYASPLARAFDTAKMIVREARLPVDVGTIDGLKERGGGILEGNTWEEQQEKNPELVEKFRSLPEEEGWRLVGAETDEEVLHRFSHALSEVRARHPEGGRVAVVSHGGAIRAFLREHFGGAVLPGSLRAANASITRLEWPAGGDPRLLELASTEHLES
jgi:broad specificity phosphatase PhoE